MSDRPRIAEVQSLLRPAQILLVRRKGLLGWAIRRVTNSDYSHAALIDCTESGVWITVEAADLSGVKAVRLVHYFYDPDVTGLLIRDRADLAIEERQAIMETAWLRVGQKYDTAQLLGIYARRRLPWLFGPCPMEANRLDSRNRAICSELVTVATMEGIGEDLRPPGMAIGNVDPGSLAVTPKRQDVWKWSDTGGRV
jgi:hypothetical protein